MVRPLFYNTRRANAQVESLPFRLGSPLHFYFQIILLFFIFKKVKYKIVVFGGIKGTAVEQAANRFGRYFDVRKRDPDSLPHPNKACGQIRINSVL